MYRAPRAFSSRTEVNNTPITSSFRNIYYNMREILRTTLMLNFRLFILF